MILVGRPSSVAGVERRRADVVSGKAFRLLYLFAFVFGVDLAGVDFLGVEASLGVDIGDDASRFVTDSRRSLAGRTRFCGIVDCGTLACGGDTWSAISATFSWQSPLRAARL